jgi:hypothetical protein
VVEKPLLNETVENLSDPTKKIVETPSSPIHEIIDETANSDIKMIEEKREPILDAVDETVEPAIEVVNETPSQWKMGKFPYNFVRYTGMFPFHQILCVYKHDSYINITCVYRRVIISCSSFCPLVK